MPEPEPPTPPHCMQCGEVGTAHVSSFGDRYTERETLYCDAHFEQFSRRSLELPFTPRIPRIFRNTYLPFRLSYLVAQSNGARSIVIKATRATLQLSLAISDADSQAVYWLGCHDMPSEYRPIHRVLVNSIHALGGDCSEIKCHHVDDHSKLIHTTMTLTNVTGRFEIPIRFTDGLCLALLKTLPMSLSGDTITNWPQK